MKQLITSILLLTVLLANAQDNYLVATVNGSDVTYPIDRPADFESNNHSSSTKVSSYNFTSNGVSSVEVERASVKSITLEIPLDNATTDYFCAWLFYNCTNLTEANITFSGDCTNVNNSFCRCMFYNCTALASLPDDFNIPQGITSVGTYFCNNMFNGCSCLVSLPDDFNIPQGITSVGTYSCDNMFNGCSGLSEGETVQLTFPFAATNAFSSTSFTPTSAEAGSTYKLKGNSDFYYKITYYDQNNEVIVIKKIALPEEGSHQVVTIGEFAVDGTTLVDDDNYAFRGWVYDLETGEKATVEDKVTGNILLYALVTAIEKADGSSEYTYDLTGQYFYPEDHDCFAYDQDGKVVLTVGPEAYVVVETSQGTTNSYYYKADESQEITLAETSISKITIYNVADLQFSTFTAGGLIYTIIDQNESTAEITGVEEGKKTLEISTKVEYKGITFTVTSIADDAFIGLKDLEVSVDAGVLENIEIGDIAAGNVGRLIVPEESRWDFYNSYWAIYFTIEGDISFTVDDFTYTILEQGSFDVELTKYSGKDGSSITISESVTKDDVDYAVISIAPDAFEGYEELEASVTFIDPATITVSEDYTGGKVGVLTVPDGCKNIYASSSWNDYFDIAGNDYLTFDELVYYTFIITYYEEKSTNKALKATSSKYFISLEVAYVAENATEVTIPRTIDLDDDSSITYVVTSMNADALNDCKDLSVINLEAPIPAQDIEKLNYTYEKCVIVLDEEELGTEYYESVKVAATVVGMKVKGVKELETGMVEVKIATDKVEVERYNLLDQKVAPQRGINIVKYSDGTVEKVLVK